MTALLVMVSLLLPTAMGFLFVSWFLKDDPLSGILDRVFLGFGAGLGLLAYLFFLLGIMGIPFTLPVLIAVQAVFSAFLLYLFIRYEGGLKQVLFSRVPFDSTRLSSKNHGQLSNLRGPMLYLGLFLVAWLLIKVLFVYYECMLRPLYSVDMWGHWASGAKFFFYERGLALEHTGWGYFGTGYRVDLGYPLLTTFLQVWVSMWIGDFHEVYVKGWSAFYYSGLLGMLFVGLRREFGWFYAVVWVFFLSSSPLLTYHGIEGLSDLPLAYYVFASVLCFWRYLEKGGGGPLMLSGVFVSLALFTKNEGLIFFFAIAIAILLSAIFKRRRFVMPSLSFLLPFILVSGPWLLFKALEGFGIGHSTSGMEAEAASFVDRSIRGAAASGAARGGAGVVAGFFHPEVFAVVVRKVLLTVNFNLIFVLWSTLTLLCAKTVIKSDIKYLYAVICVVMAFFLSLYLTTEAPFVEQATAIFRNMLTYAPLLFFATGLLLSRYLCARGGGNEGGGGEGGAG